MGVLVALIPVLDLVGPLPATGTAWAGREARTSGLRCCPAFMPRICWNAFQLRNAFCTVPSSNVTVSPGPSFPLREHALVPVEWMVSLITMHTSKKKLGRLLTSHPRGRVVLMADGDGGLADSAKPLTERVSAMPLFPVVG